MTQSRCAGLERLMADRTNLSTDLACPAQNPQRPSSRCTSHVTYDIVYERTNAYSTRQSAHNTLDRQFPAISPVTLPATGHWLLFMRLLTSNRPACEQCKPNHRLASLGWSKSKRCIRPAWHRVAWLRPSEPQQICRVRAKSQAATAASINDS